MTTPPEQPAPLSVDEFRTLTLGAMSRDQLYRVISAAEAERDALKDRLASIADYEPNISGDADFATLKAIAQEALSPGNYVGENPYVSERAAIHRDVSTDVARRREFGGDRA